DASRRDAEILKGHVLLPSDTSLRDAKRQNQNITHTKQRRAGFSVLGFRMGALREIGYARSE
ncbi:MAG: hypothetical protein LBU70_03370, partial [Chitinispirillales bacterium]|nr:hypothetical protein [Chitinispirillales bacterium]